MIRSRSISLEEIISLLGGKKQKTFGVLDVGSGSVKFLLIRQEFDRKGAVKKIIILAKELQEYERFGVFDGRDFELDIVRKAIQEVLKEASQKGESGVETWVVGLPPHIFKARIVSRVFERECPQKAIDKQEQQRILGIVLEEARKQVAGEFVRRAGILPQELHFLCTRILEAKIDGYSVPRLLGFKGRRLECRALITFLPKYYWEGAQKLVQGFGFKHVEILHESQGLVKFLARERDTLFLDIGADFTQIFLKKQGSLVAVSEFKFGAKNFSQSLRKHLGISLGMAKDLCVRYQEGSLGEEIRHRLHEIFLREAENWHSNLKIELEGKMFFETISLFGGGAYFLEIRQVLEKIYETRIEIMDIKNMFHVEDRARGGKSLQFMPTLFLTHAF